MSEDPMDVLISDTESVRLVRSALAHLYDPAYLQNHPLVFMLDLGLNSDHVTRAQKIRRILLECIEALRPETPGHDRAAAARAYAILTYRCVDGLAMEEIAAKLALSRRQVYREYGKGVKAVASLLRDRIREAGEQEAGKSMEGGDERLAVEAPAGERLEAAQAEVARLQQAGQAKESLSLDDVLEGVIDLLAPLAHQTGVQMRLSLLDTRPSIVANRVMLRQALLNLLSHALHAARGDLVIALSYGKGEVLIDVAESAAATQARPALSPMVRPDGVGLAVAQALIEAQGGRLETHEQEGAWRARVVLPVSGRATILVVDDNADLIALFQRYLGGHDVSVVGVADGEQTLPLAAELQPRLVTLDVMMPHLDGWEILQRLKDAPETSHIPVIVCSVLHEPQLALAMGASDFITKPVRQTELLEVLQRWLGPLPSAA